MTPLDTNQPTNPVSVSADLKEVAGRLARLSFRDMLLLSEMLRSRLAEADSGAESSQDIAQSLLETADDIRNKPSCYGEKGSK